MEEVKPCIISEIEETLARIVFASKDGHRASYNLCVNSSRLGIEGTYSLVASFLRQVLDSGK